MFSWALGSAMAAVAGIFLAEELATLDVQTLTLLILAAFAAAIIGRLKSLPLTFLGGLLIGLVFEFQQNFLSWTGRWTTAPLAIPQIMLFLALLFLPQARIEGKKAIRQVAPRIPKIRVAVLGMAILFVVVAFLGVIAERVDVRTLTLTHHHRPHHGVAGPADRLVEADLARADHLRRRRRVRVPAVGPFPRHHRRSRRRLAVRDPVRRGHGAAGAAPAGPLPRAGVDGVRADGRDPLLPATGDPRLRRQTDPGVEHPRVRFQPAVPLPRHRLRPGRRHPAVLSPPRSASSACSSSGCTRAGSAGGSPRWATARRRAPPSGSTRSPPSSIVFVISAAIAGFAGALLGIFQGTATVQDFEMLQGLAYLLLLVVGGVAVVSGAVLGGFFLSSFTWISAQFPSNTILTWWSRLGPGLAGIGIGRQPSGIIPTVGEDLRAQNARKRAEREAAGLPPAPRPDTTPPAPQPAGRGAAGTGRLTRRLTRPAPLWVSRVRAPRGSPRCARRLRARPGARPARRT